MPTAIDLIGHNQALQEHWIRRFFAGVADAIIISVVYLIVTLPLALFRIDFVLLPFFWGIMMWLYATFLEGVSGATIGKRLLALRVVALDGPMDLARALIRNISKVHPLLLVLDLILGAFTHGDPRQRYLDRIARTTVTRVDQQAYMEEQFRMMQVAPPRPMAPPPGAYGTAPPAPPSAAAAPQAPPPGGWPTPAGGWPGQEAQAPTWPQHQWDEEGRLKPQMRFCTNCGGQLVARGDGKLTCVRCGAVY